MAQDGTPDPVLEWGDDPTLLDSGQFVQAIEADSDQITKPNAIAPMLEDARAKGHEEGCRSCYSEGQADALIALRSLLLEKGATNDHAAHVIAAVRQRLTKL